MSFGEADAEEKGDEPPKATGGASSGKTLACDSALQTIAHSSKIPEPIGKDPEIEAEKGICPVRWWYVFHWGPECHYLVGWCRNTKSSRACPFPMWGQSLISILQPGARDLKNLWFLSCIQPRNTTGFLFSHKTWLGVLCHWAGHRKWKLHGEVWFGIFEK